jgi:hypothetical protein
MFQLAFGSVEGLGWEKGHRREAAVRFETVSFLAWVEKAGFSIDE